MNGVSLVGVSQKLAAETLSSVQLLHTVHIVQVNGVSLVGVSQKLAAETMSSVQLLHTVLCR